MKTAKENQSKQVVAICKTNRACYSKKGPFHPAHNYPEYPFGKENISTEVNPGYDGVRTLFSVLKYDYKNYETKQWNPLGWLIKPGMKVVIKPNFVLSKHPSNKNIFSIITHPSVLRAVADYTWIALQGEGDIIIADSPQYDCNWDDLMEVCQLKTLQTFYSRRSSKITFYTLDLRPYWSRKKHFKSMLEKLPGDPKGSLFVNLGAKSFLSGKKPEKLYGAVYNRKETQRHHQSKKHIYAVSKTILSADAVICVPKMKVHKKVGVTLNLKNLVGITTNKNFLVHYSLTPPSKGGDQYPDGLFNPIEEFLIKTERFMYDQFLARGNIVLELIHRSIYGLHNSITKKMGLKVNPKKRLLDAGNWSGNDSAWRMAADLYNIFLYADKYGKIKKTIQRNVFSIIDGIIGGDDCGPLNPNPRKSGILIGGKNLLFTDIVATILMGLNPCKIKMFLAFFGKCPEKMNKATKAIKCISNKNQLIKDLNNIKSKKLNYKPHIGWRNYLEATVE